MAMLQTLSTPAPWVGAFEPTEQTIRNATTRTDRETGGCSQAGSVPFKG